MESTVGEDKLFGETCAAQNNKIFSQHVHFCNGVLLLGTEVALDSHSRIPHVDPRPIFTAGVTR